jgi:dihydropteroate synthase
MVSGELAGVRLGEGYPVRIMGIINVSPESFYKGSVKSGASELSETASAMVKDGADIIDVGGMSTAPNAKEIPLEEEKERLSTAIKIIKDTVDVPISADTPRSVSAKAALDAGAKIVNDVGGLKYDPAMKTLISESHASAMLMAHEVQEQSGTPLQRVSSALLETLALARSAGIEEEKIVLDPGLGFFQKNTREFGYHSSKEIPWYVWDCMIIKDLARLELKRPIGISISRKSFIGKILGLQEPKDRLFGSLAATSIAVFNGVHLVRTHDVAATRQAARIAEFIRNGK